MDIRSKLESLDTIRRAVMSLNEQDYFQFQELVKAEFVFMLGHGFEQKESDPTSVRFESSHTYVNVFIERKSLEIGLEVGRLELVDDEEAPFSMSEIIRLLEPSKAQAYRDYAAHSEVDLVNGVRRLSTIFGHYINAGVFDDLGIFGKLRKEREKWRHDFAREVKLRQVLDKAGEAWAEKDYVKIVSLLHPFQDCLSRIELRKLEYAEKKLANREDRNGVNDQKSN